MLIGSTVHNESSCRRRSAVIPDKMRSFGGNQSDAARAKFLWFLASDLNYDDAVKNKDNFLRARMHSAKAAHCRCARSRAERVQCRTKNRAEFPSMRNLLDKRVLRRAWTETV